MTKQGNEILPNPPALLEIDMTTTTASKAVNYTAEQTTEMVAVYKANPTAATVEALAVSMGKTVRSIVAKLSREGVYAKKERTTKTGEAVVKKDSLCDQLALLVNLTDAEADSLSKANKTALQKLIKAVKDNTLSEDHVS